MDPFRAKADGRIADSGLAGAIRPCRCWWWQWWSTLFLDSERGAIGDVDRRS